MLKPILALTLSFNLCAALAVAAATKKSEPKPEPKAEAKPEASPEPTPAPTEAAKQEEEKPQADFKRKSPAVAGALALFPGFIVHGTGHMYAGSWMKGLGLLAIQGSAIYIGVRAGVEGAQEISSLMSSGGNSSVPTDFSGAYTKIGMASVATMAVLWSWFDDMAGAPIAANEYNKRQEAAAQAKLRLLPRRDGAAMALTTEF